MESRPAEGGRNIEGTRRVGKASPLVNGCLGDLSREKSLITDASMCVFHVISMCWGRGGGGQNFIRFWPDKIASLTSKE